MGFLRQADEHANSFPQNDLVAMATIFFHTRGKIYFPGIPLYNAVKFIKNITSNKKKYIKI